MFGERIVTPLCSRSLYGNGEGCMRICITKLYSGGEVKNLPNNPKSISRHLRKVATPAEVILWEEIRNRKLGGLKFRRQYPVLGFILDFYCAEKSLGIELDGSIHDSQDEYDKWREKVILEKGIRIVRFTNQEIIEDIEDVKRKIILL